MSAAKIIEELPKLSPAEVRLVRQRLIELAALNDDVAHCDQAALEGAMMLDRLERNFSV
jgi:Fe-S-cluster formation regulator IscX/YfhJ